MAQNKVVIFFILIFSFGKLVAQKNDSAYSHNVVNTKRLNAFIATSATTYSVAMVGLHQLWYKNNEQQSFRFFNDNAEWKQIDKAGHFFSAFYLSAATSEALQWSGVKPSKSDLIGSLTGFLVLLPVEIFDGHSAAYGASTGDLIANAAGPAFYLMQKSAWNQIRIQPKFSFHQTGYAALRPNTLGDTFMSELLKDYNGQTYWLSADMDKFIKFPKWLNLAVGYGGQSLVYGRDNENYSFGFDPYRQYYLSLDFDLTAIPTRSKFVRTLLHIGSIIKLPAPTLELSRKGNRFHILYF